VLSNLFFRNKGAYIVGRAINGAREYPFVIPVLHNRRGELVLDTVLTDPLQIAVLFSFTRAYFLVDMEVPSAYVQFLRSLLRANRRAKSIPCSACKNRARPCSTAITCST
jgi:isocitrate dehydrogenase kinase/phosphatase